jgi:predicted aldo/keto reductase-like oxidoreductase
MIYRTLGKTGLQVSQLGFGAMRLPMAGEGDAERVNRELAIPMIHKAFSAGVNYIDTAVIYCRDDSQRVVGEALKGWRDKVIVSTKNHYYGEDEKEWWAHLENSLDRLQISQIDIYNHHGISWQKYADAVAPRVSHWMQKAKGQGLIKHICTSFHDDATGLRRIVDAGYVDVTTLQYNLLDRKLEDGIAHAREHGVGIVVMGPVGGGRLGADVDVFRGAVPRIQRVPELALRFVLSNPHISVALSGMSTMAQVEENLRIAGDPTALRPADQAAIREQLRRLQKMADLYCTGCKYCLPCEHGVNIPGIFEQYNLGRVYGVWDHARKVYGWFSKDKKSADLCVDCGGCEEKCPQHIPIRQQLKEAHAALVPKQKTAVAGNVTVARGRCRRPSASQLP